MRGSLKKEQQIEIDNDIKNQMNSMIKLSISNKLDGSLEFVD